jgi:endonuclease/exonuclease/phosphatase family metal-dependent hydrolase
VKLITWNIQWGLGMDGRLDLERIVAEARAWPISTCSACRKSPTISDLKGSRGENQFAAIAALLRASRRSRARTRRAPTLPGRRKRFGQHAPVALSVGQVLRYTLPWEPPRRATCRAA